MSEQVKTEGSFKIKSKPKLTEEQIALLEFKWYKDNNLISSFNKSEITIHNYEENGNDKITFN
mgnify:CR=1 FL=1